MDATELWFFSFLIVCGETSSCSNTNIFNSEYLNPKSIDHNQISGRWYLYKDTPSMAIRDGDFVVFKDGRLINIVYHWVPDREECQISAVSYVPTTSNSSEADTSARCQVTQMSTNEVVGTYTIVGFNGHATDGFVIVREQKEKDDYLIATRQKDASDLDDVIKAYLRALNVDPRQFNVKSADYGCERIEDRKVGQLICK